MMYSEDASRIAVISVNEKFEVNHPDYGTEMRRRIEVVFLDDYEKGNQELTVSEWVYPLDEIKTTPYYMVICDENNFVEFLEEAPTYIHRESFVCSYYPAIKEAIFKLQDAIYTCPYEQDRLLINQTIDNLFFSMIALAKKSNLPEDEEFFFPF